MANFHKSRGGSDRGGKHFGGGRSFGGGGGKRGGFGGGRDGRPPKMHPATCDDCGSPCEVPFRPTDDRPVYCDNCFRNDGKPNKRQERDYDDRDFGRNSGRPTMYEATCDECGMDCEVPFRPSGDKPIFCSNCFKKNGKGGGNDGGNKSMEQFKEKIEILNIKLDRILKALSQMAPAAEKSEKTVEKSAEKAGEAEVSEAPKKAKKTKKAKV